VTPQDALCRRYESWELAAAAEHAAYIVGSAAPEQAPRVHRALLEPLPGPAVRPATGTMVRLLLDLAASDDWRTRCPDAGRLGYQDLPTVEALSQLQAFARAFVEWATAPQAPATEVCAAGS
jgi:hypothetical protein